MSAIQFWNLEAANTGLLVGLLISLNSPLLQCFFFFGTVLDWVGFFCGIFFYEGYLIGSSIRWYVLLLFSTIFACVYNLQIFMAMTFDSSIRAWWRDYVCKMDQVTLPLIFYRVWLSWTSWIPYILPSKAFHCLLLGLLVFMQHWTSWVPYPSLWWMIINFFLSCYKCYHVYVLKVGHIQCIRLEWVFGGSKCWQWRFV